MKNRTLILTLFILLLFLPTSEVLACGNSMEQFKSEGNYCSVTDYHNENRSCCHSEKNQGNDGLGGSCSNTPCHCPASINAPVYLADFESTITNKYHVSEKDWIYIQQIPKSVYLPIWQRPKIG